MSDCILGIKCRGVSTQIDTLTIESDQTEYDYVCNVALLSSSNGNGQYSVSIVNKDLASGMPVGKWRIIKSRILYNWGASYAMFIMKDEQGNETDEITASEQRGSVSGFSVALLTRSIFIKAQQVVIDYPSAPICNAMLNLEKAQSDYTWKFIKSSYKDARSKPDELIGLIDYATTEIKEYMTKYNEAKGLLEKCEDPRAELLLRQIKEDCLKLLDRLLSHNE